MKKTFFLITSVILLASSAMAEAEKSYACKDCLKTHEQKVQDLINHNLLTIEAAESTVADSYCSKECAKK